MLLAIKANGGPTPSLDTRPELPESLVWPYTQFSELTRERRYTHDTPLPLYLTDIDLYWSRFVKHDYEEFYELITTIDNIYLKVASKKREQRAQSEKKGSQ